jgi:MFS family permease
MLRFFAFFVFCFLILSGLFQFNLVCDRDFIPSTISSLQLAGSLAGNVISGHVADQFGRKLPFFMSILLVLLFNFLGFFASAWQMFAVCTFFTGLGYGVFTATQYNILSEFTLAKWRTWIVGFPSWPIQQSIFALCAWLVHDWRYMQLITALMAIPCLFAWL